MFGRNVLISVGAVIQEYIHTNRRVVYLFLAALVVRLLYFVFMLGQVLPSQMAALSPDVTHYMAAAQGLSPTNESALFLFGWGYPAFLWLCSLIVGYSPVWLLLIQIVLSSLSCVLVYRVASELMDNETIAMIAGYLAAASLTSISLANFLLSDTLFFLLFALGNLWFIKGLKLQSRKYFILSGIALASAVCTRSMAQFWPVVMVVLFIVWPLLQASSGKKREILRYLKIGFWAPLIVLVVMTAWMIRNNTMHDLPIMAFAGPHGVGKVIANAQGKLDGRAMADVQSQWYDEYRQETGVEELSYHDIYTVTMQQFWRMVSEHPGAVISTYAHLVWGNMVANNELYMVQCPKYGDRLQRIHRVLIKKGNTKILFLFALIGGIVLLVRNRTAAVYLGVIFIYVALMAGFGQWQGSRLFYPAMLTEAILVSCFLVWGCGYLGRKLSPAIHSVSDTAIIRILASICGRCRRAVYSYFVARPFLFAVFLLGVLMHFGFFLFMSGQVWISTISTLTPDSIQYMKIAGGILGHNPPNEYGIMIFGPGFGVYLAVIMFLFGSHGAILLFFQHLLAAANVLILYEVARDISKSNKIGIIAAALYATSFTAIALTNLILSDVLFFCLYLLSILLLLKSLNRFRWRLVILSGIVLGAAILVKSIGQFLIVGLLLLPLLYIKEMTPAAAWKKRIHWYARYAVAPLIALVIIGGWMTRNYVVHDKAMLAFTGAGGPSNIALRAIAKEENRETGDVYAEWVEAYRTRTGLTELSLSDDYDMRTLEVRKTIGKYPGAMMSVYLDLTWENLTATNELYFTQCPTYKYDIDSGVLWYKAHFLNFVSFWMTVCGLALMLLRRRWRLFFFTAGLLVYFAGLIGFTQFQGSRLFFPGLAAFFISIGFVIESSISSKKKPA